MSDERKLGPVSVWSLAAGGMVGGGIYTALGVVIAVAAQWAWLSFVIAGVAALCTAWAYATLANEFEESGGAFEYLREIDHAGLAGSLSWVLILGYVLTMAVYAFAFGHYLSFTLASIGMGGTWTTRGLAVGIVAALVALNLQGVGAIQKAEKVIVLGNLLALVALGVWGLFAWDPSHLVGGIEPRGPWAAVIGAAAIFMSYEGFQLLTYEYDEIERPEKLFRPTLLVAVLFVIVIYVGVTLGAAMLSGALTLIDQKQVALAVAARDAAGTWGLLVMTVAAGFATAAAINSTLFSTARLAARVAGDGELPAWLDHPGTGEGSSGASGSVPGKAVCVLGATAALLAITGSLSTLVEAASLAFLFTFGAVDWIAWKRAETHRWIPLAGLAVVVSIGVALLLRLALTALVPLLVLALFVAVATVGRPMILARVATEGDGDGEGR